MSDLRALIGTELQWRRTRWIPMAFRLTWNDQEVGSLAWEGLFTSRAIARLADDAWRIRRQGLLGLSVENVASGDVVATMSLNFFGSGELALSDGRQFPFRRAGFFPPAWSFLDHTGSELVGIRGRLGTLLRGGHCRIQPGAAEVPAGMLALIGVYIVVRRARRRARDSG